MLGIRVEDHQARVAVVASVATPVPTDQFEVLPLVGLEVAPAAGKGVGPAAVQVGATRRVGSVLRVRGMPV